MATEAKKQTKKPSEKGRNLDNVWCREDFTETYEMLRAAHTLLRMAFGALALITSPDKEEEAKKFVESFNYAFRCIRSGAELVLEKSKQAKPAQANS